MSLKFNIIQGKTSLRRSLGSVLYQILPSKIKNKPVVIGLHFVNEEEIKNLNNQYRSKNLPTDVLSFPLDLDLQNNYSEIDFGDIKHTTSAVSIYVNRSFYSFLQKSVKTDLSASELFAAISFIRGVDLANSKVYYLNEDTFSTQKFFDNFWKGVNTTTYDENSRVLVLNSAQVSGLAGWGGRVLENLGLTLLDVANLDTKHNASFIVAKDMDSKIVSILSEVFGIKEIKSREEVEDSENAFERGDIVIVLGIDIADGL